VTTVPPSGAGRQTAARTGPQQPGRPVPPAGDAVLLINPRSGGGKAERVGLARECTARGIEPVLLRPGQDVVALAEAAVAGGAEVIGMAGGDGSLALVAGVAARNAVPMVVVPAGTRNHLAMDLGLDRDDVTGALDAYGAAVERAVDLGDVNGRAFVNNVSLGLYAQIIRSPRLPGRQGGHDPQCAARSVGAR
jgi:diacylglycerol kinase family enzyme